MTAERRDAATLPGGDVGLSPAMETVANQSMAVAWL